MTDTSNNARPARPANTPWMMPYLVVQDAVASLAFYEKAFGFTPGLIIPDGDGKPMHAEMHWQDARIMFAPEGGQGVVPNSPKTAGIESPMALMFYVEDVDAAFARAVDAGAIAVKPPADMFWGDRACSVKDPSGYQWTLATNVADFDPANVPTA